jgi:hypothetical protein
MRKLLLAKYHMFFLKFVFLAALASWLCRLHSFWLFLADQPGKNFGQQFFSGPRYVVDVDVNQDVIRESQQCIFAQRKLRNFFHHSKSPR